MPARLSWQNQMAFPVELSLKRFPVGIRLCRQPIPEIQALYEDRKAWDPFIVKPGENPLAELRGDQLDIQMELDLGEASAVEIDIRGHALRYSVPAHELNLEGIKAPISLAGKHLDLRLLVDLCSLEVFANSGQVSISRVFFFDPSQKQFSLQCEGGASKVTSLTVHHVASIWEGKNGPIPAP
jgi:sucrose-6-phosphate hydrolase SacC (GH32 family)